MHLVIGQLTKNAHCLNKFEKEVAIRKNCQVHAHKNMEPMSLLVCQGYQKKVGNMWQLKLQLPPT